MDVRDGENADDDDGGGSEEGELHGSREYVSAAAADAHGGGGRMYFRWMKRQKGFIRFNCADSLDRTNVATFCTCHSPPPMRTHVCLFVAMGQTTWH